MTMDPRSYLSNDIRWVDQAARLLANLGFELVAPDRDRQVTALNRSGRQNEQVPHQGAPAPAAAARSLTTTTRGPSCPDFGRRSRTMGSASSER